MTIKLTEENFEVEVDKVFKRLSKKRFADVDKFERNVDNEFKKFDKYFEKKFKKDSANITRKINLRYKYL